MFYEIAYGILLGWLSWEDMKHLRIHTIGLAGLSCVSLMEISQKPYADIWIPFLMAALLYFSLWFLNRLAIYLKKSSIIGQGDIWLLSILATAIANAQLPFFMLIVGIVSLPWGLYWTHGQKHPRFPMVPSIALAFMVMRTFL